MWNTNTRKLVFERTAEHALVPFRRRFDIARDGLKLTLESAIRIEEIELSQLLENGIVNGNEVTSTRAKLRRLTTLKYACMRFKEIGNRRQFSILQKAYKSLRRYLRGSHLGRMIDSRYGEVVALRSQAITGYRNSNRLTNRFV